MQVFEQKAYLSVVNEACKVRGFKKPTPEELLLNSIFNNQPHVPKYLALLKEIDAELKNQGYTHIRSTEGVLNELE